MTPAARVQTAIELIDTILDGAPAERTLTNWARNSRFAGSKDRAAVRDHVYDVLRQKNSLAARGGAATGRGLMIGLMRQQGTSLEGIFSGTSYAPSVLTDEERADPPMRTAIDLPEWLIAEFQSSLGDDFTEIEQALRQRAPVILRANLRMGDRKTALQALAQEDITGVAHPLSDTAIEITEGARRIKGSRAYAQGLVELQDVASQAAIDQLPLTDSMRIMDYCAGGGGKLLAMAGRSNGTFFAHDAFPQRLRDLPQRAKRAGVKATVLDTDDVPQAAPYDLVFCDVPCSGSGTWRRDPGSKWRFTSDDLTEITALQADILKQAASLVQAGGYLAYATCSLLRQENHAQIERFLVENTSWTLKSQHQWTPLDGSDGFFLTVLTTV